MWRMVGIFAVTGTIWVLGRFGWYKLPLRSMAQSVYFLDHGLGLSLATPVQRFEHEFREAERVSREEAVSVLRAWIMKSVLMATSPRPADMKKLQRLKLLKPAGQDGQAVFPEATFELIGPDHHRVFFRKNLTLAGVTNL